MKMGGIAFSILVGVATLGVVSCEDKAMTATIKGQQADIDRWESIENRLLEQIKGDPLGNPTAELAQLVVQLDETKAEISTLEDKRDGLEDSRDALVKKFEAYQRKYRVAE